MLQRLRRPLVVRLAVPAFVLGLALGWAAPARAARAWADERARAATLLAADDTARVEAAVREAAARASTPEAFAAEVVRALAAHPSAADVTPAADRLLRSLYGHFLRAMSLEHGPHAVFLAARPDVTLAPAAPVALGGARVAVTTVRAASDEARGLDAVVRLPLVERPAVQSLGP